MTTEDLSPTEREELKKEANVWRVNYAIALDDLVFNPNGTLMQFIEVAWEKGFLEHVSPREPETRAARARLNRTLWRERNDPVLYWRMQYALEYFRASMSHTRAEGPATAACVDLIVAMDKLDQVRKHVFFPKLRHHSNWPWPEVLVDLLINEAQQALRALGVTPHDPTLRSGSTGVFRDIPCTVERVLSDGTIFLKVLEFGPQNENLIKMVDFHQALTPDGIGICPSLIDASGFTRGTGKFGRGKKG